MALKRGAARKMKRRSLLAPLVASLALVVPAWAASGAPAGSIAVPSTASARNAVLPQLAVTINLCAKTGTAPMPTGPDVPIWGLATAATPALCATATPTLPGPVLDVAVEDVVTVTLTNVDVPEDVGLQFYGQDLPPDTTGVAVGAPLPKTYTFTASEPGTFLYQAGTNSSVQVPMGLYGALVVRPRTVDCSAPTPVACDVPGGTDGANYAYNDIATQFDQEAVLVLSEVDRDLNNTADPNDFNMLGYKPEFWLINGVSYPDASLDPIVSATAGQKVLLRYVNAGLMHHTMTMLGMRADLVAKDGYPANFPTDIVAETIAAGSTADAIVTTPAVTGATTFPVYSRNLNLDNAGTAQGAGGMMAFVEIAP